MERALSQSASSQAALPMQDLMTHPAGTILFSVPSGNCASKSAIVATSVKAINRVTIEVAVLDKQHCYNCQLCFWLDRLVTTLIA